MRIGVLLLSLSVCAAAGCGGGGTAAPTAPVVAPPPLPVLTSMTNGLTSTSIQEGQEVVATLQPLDSHGKPMTVGLPAWTSSAPTIADVSSSGLITTFSVGRATISATVGTVTGSVTITVTPYPPGPRPVAALAVTPLSGLLQIGQTLRLAALPTDFAGNPLSGRAITWTSNSPAIATVSADGVVTAYASGEVVIEATSEGKNSAASLNVTAALDSTIVVTILNPQPNVVLGDTMTFVAAVRGPSPIDSVVVNFGGLRTPMTYGPIGGGSKFPPAMGWTAKLNLVTLATGKYLVIMTATDSRGHVSLATIAVDHDPKIHGGSKQPVGSK